MLGVSAARVSKIERQPGAVTLDNLLDVLRLLGARIELVDHASVSSAALPARSRGRTQSTRQAAPTASRKKARGPVRPAGEW
jgi:hypothetical protein